MIDHLDILYYMNIKRVTPDTEQHPLHPPCKDSCRRQCTRKFSVKQREDIHRDFWSLGYNRRRDYLVHNVTVEEKRTNTCKRSKSLRQNTWRLGDHAGCKRGPHLGYLGGKVVISALNNANVDTRVLCLMLTGRRTVTSVTRHRQRVVGPVGMPFIWL